ncbi:outer membrane beta-barrel family protein [Sphingobacterium bambusae]|uniref:TonB-dependent receptor domain-containing protein n=1 Tax=Sphingobacterium bambusae TaxID=662858 RepID=A0ABW6BLP6_9SPHI|nr:outer membrane beta-barrel family protein [Sphingobacterium bambusae]WPL46671.1 outer membrane beta-barrel family protein [Sphingobacterium bambusae]
MNIHLLTLFLLCAGMVCKTFAQTTLTGKILHEDGRAFENVSVDILLLPDSLSQGQTITDESGNYLVQIQRAGTFLLRYSAVGQQTQFSRNYSLKNGDKQTVAPIILKTAPISLASVNVEGKLPGIRQYVDKMVVDVEGSVAAEGNNVLELLEKTPGVLSDGKGNFSIQGRTGATVKIDGKETYLTGAQLASLLRGMQARDISKLELMSSPSAKEDAAGSAGAINIVTKKNRRGGFGADVFVRGGQSRKSQGSFGGGVHYKTEKLNVFLQASRGYESSKESSYSERTFGDVANPERRQVQREERILDPGKYHSLHTGFVYEADSNSTLEASINWIKGLFISTSNIDMDIYRRGVSSIDRAATRNSFDEGYNNLTFNVNYAKKYRGEDHYLKANIDFAPHTNDYDNIFHTDYYAASSNNVTGVSARHNLQDLHNTTYAARLDYSRPLKNLQKIELGWKATHLFIDNAVQNDTLSNSMWVNDRNSSNAFQYTQHVQAAYLTYSGKLSKIEYQLGLRGEYTFTKANQVTTGESDRNNYFDLFPNAFLMYHLTENHVLRGSLSSRIQRPSDHDVNVFRVYEDAFTYFQGNADIKPEKSTIVEIGHSYKNKLFTTLSYGNNRDVITFVSRAGESANETYSRPENIGQFTNYSASVMYNNRFASWWSGSHYLNAFHNAYRGEIDGTVLDNEGSSWTLNSKHTLEFPWTMRSELIAYYNSGITSGARRKEKNYGVDLAFEKKLWADRAMLKLAVNGLVRNRNPRYSSTFGDLTIFHSARPDNRKVLLTLSYRFGK